MAPKVNVKLTGKSAVVTGASRGVGQRMALSLAEHGASVALVARRKPLLDETARMIIDRGGRAVAIQADLSDLSVADRVVAQVREALGKPSILINGAGIFGPIQLIKDSDPHWWLQTLNINALMPYLLCRAFVGSMIEQGWGRIVNVTSAAALHQPGPLNSAYGSSKVALNQMTRHLASEIAGTGVTANVIHPGDVKTDMWAEIRDNAASIAGPLGEGYRDWARWVESTGGDDPQKAADLVINLMSDEAASVNGQFLWIENGLQAPVPSWGEADRKEPWLK